MEMISYRLYWINWLNLLCFYQKKNWLNLLCFCQKKMMDPVNKLAWMYVNKVTNINYIKLRYKVYILIMVKYIVCFRNKIESKYYFSFLDR